MIEPQNLFVTANLTRQLKCIKLTGVFLFLLVMYYVKYVIIIILYGAICSNTVLFTFRIYNFYFFNNNKF